MRGINQIWDEGASLDFRIWDFWFFGKMIRGRKAMKKVQMFKRIKWRGRGWERKKDGERGNWRIGYLDKRER